MYARRVRVPGGSKFHLAPGTITSKIGVRVRVPALILGTGGGINSVHYNIVLESKAYVKTTVPNKVLGSTVCVKNIVLGSKSRAINTVPI